MRRLVALPGVLVLLLASGCSGGDEVGDARTTPTVSSPTASVTTETVPPSSEPAAPAAVSVVSHCGVVSVTVDGQLWLADPPLGDHNPPPGWGEQETSGQWIPVGRDRAEFYGDHGQRASFRRAEPGTPDPNAGCE